MKKFVYVAMFCLVAGVVGGYSLTTTMTDLFATGNDGSGGPLFRISSTGGVYAVGTSELSGTTTLSGTNTLSGATTLSGGATLSGSNTISGATTISGQATFSVAPVIPLVDVTVSSPTAFRQVVSNTDYKLYVSTGIGKCAYWLAQ